MFLILHVFHFSDYRNLDTYVPRKTRWDTEKLPSFRKNFYREHPNSVARPQVMD